jgi:hypothetical protein
VSSLLVSSSLLHAAATSASTIINATMSVHLFRAIGSPFSVPCLPILRAASAQRIVH